MTCRISDAPDDEGRRWTWRNCRAVVLAIHLLPFPWQWHFAWWETMLSEHYEWEGHVQFGPVVITISADSGNVSTGDWRARFGLSDEEAWKRSRPAPRKP